MKRRDLLRHLAHHGCAFLREGGNHTLCINRMAKKVSTISPAQRHQPRPHQKDLQRPSGPPATRQLGTPYGASARTARPFSERKRGPGTVPAMTTDAEITAWWVPVRRTLERAATAHGAGGATLRGDSFTDSVHPSGPDAWA